MIALFLQPHRIIEYQVFPMGDDRYKPHMQAQLLTFLTDNKETWKNEEAMSDTKSYDLFKQYKKQVESFIHFI